MRHKYTVAGFLVVGLLCSQALLGATQGGIQGRVLVNLKALEGVPLTLVNVQTGRAFTVRTARDGAFSVSLPNGSYVVSSAGVKGLSIGKAPVLIQVTGGKFASANIELARALVQDAPAGGVTIFHNPIGCVAKNEFPVFDTTFQPTSSVVSARLYFKSNLSDEWFYTEFQSLTGNFPKYKWTMAPDPANPAATVSGDDIRRRWVNLDEPQPVDPGVPPTHRAFLPKIKEGSGIVSVTYYIQVTLSDFTETRTREIETRVLGKGDACKGGAFSAPAGAPVQGLTVLGSGGLAGAPAGFAGTLGLSLATDLIPTVLGAGLVTAADLNAAGGGGDAGSPTPTATPIGSTSTPTPNPAGGSPTPTPTPTPPAGAPTPTPTPTPTPVPDAPTCRVNVAVNPPGGSTNPCQVSVSYGSSSTIVTSSQAFDVVCSSPVSLAAIIGPPASFTSAPAASWSGACSGDAVGTPCSIPATLPAVSTVTLECGCAPSKVPTFASTCGGPSPSPSGSPAGLRNRNR